MYFRHGPYFCQYFYIVTCSLSCIVIFCGFPQGLLKRGTSVWICSLLSLYLVVWVLWHECLDWSQLWISVLFSLVSHVQTPVSSLCAKYNTGRTHLSTAFHTHLEPHVLSGIFSSHLVAHMLHFIPSQVSGLLQVVIYEYSFCICLVYFFVFHLLTCSFKCSLNKNVLHYKKLSLPCFTFFLTLALDRDQDHVSLLSRRARR